ncbi:unnamed protein product [Clonostachys byssicola]|uniref:NAD-dependent epimerase/dehydratase domain-containing protein n=1 Tax=Clonostachys byssicola TaxID=160290 RepID=A0A9N9UDI4_9HYPO|nr:unnamed protein product [Clonostachys byssicola]
MSPLQNPALPKGSLVLVTGANGFLGSHVADQFLHYGYNVRATVRDTVKHAWYADLFEKKYGKDRFELVQVDDMSKDGAFNEAIKGVKIFVHTASVMTFDPDPKNVIPTVIAGVLNALKAAYAEPSVKRFVFTSSSSAVVTSHPDVPPIVATDDTENEWAVKHAWSEPPYPADHGARVYEASKTQAEQELWKFHRENRSKRPDLVVNTVLPNLVFGRSLDPVRQGYLSSGGLIPALWQGQVLPFHKAQNPQYFVDVQDVGRLHVIGALFEKVKDQRLFGFADRFSWDKILEIMRKQEPNRKIPDNFLGGEDPHEIPPRHKAEQLLKELGLPGWTSLEDCVSYNLEALRASS